MYGLDREKWEMECRALVKKLQPKDFLQAVTKKTNAPEVRSFEVESVYQYAFIGACLAGQEDHARLILDEGISGKHKLDSAMCNYIILKEGDLEALKVYASLVDMNELQGTDEDWCHIHIPAIYNKPDVLNYCHQIGYAEDDYEPFDFVAIMIANNHFESARNYAKEHNAKPTFERWNRIIRNLAKNHEGSSVRSPIERLECLKSMYPEHDIYSSDPLAAIHSALGNNAVDVAQYFVDNGAPTHHLISTSGVEAIFSTDFGIGYTYPDVINWLLDMDAAFSTEQAQKVLLTHSHRNGGEPIIERMIELIEPKDIPWEQMLIKACGTYKSKVVDRMEHLSSLHDYSTEDYQKAVDTLTSGWKDPELTKSVQEHFSVKQGSLSADTTKSRRHGRDQDLSL